MEEKNGIEIASRINNFNLNKILKIINSVQFLYILFKLKLEIRCEL